MRFRKIFLFCSLFPASVAAAEWLEVARTDTKTHVYIDASEDYTKDGFKFTWVKYDHSGDRKTRLRTTKERYAIYCDNRKISLMSYVTYKPDGSVYDSDSWNYYRWTDVIPESIGEAIYDSYCTFLGNYRRNKAVNPWPEQTYAIDTSKSVNDTDVFVVPSDSTSEYNDAAPEASEAAAW